DPLSRGSLSHEKKKLVPAPSTRRGTRNFYGRGPGCHFVFDPGLPRAGSAPGFQRTVLADPGLAPARDRQDTAWSCLSGTRLRRICVIHPGSIRLGDGRNESQIADRNFLSGSSHRALADADERAARPALRRNDFPWLHLPGCGAEFRRHRRNHCHGNALRLASRRTIVGRLGTDWVARHSGHHLYVGARRHQDRRCQLSAAPQLQLIPLLCLPRHFRRPPLPAQNLAAIPLDASNRIQMSERSSTTCAANGNASANMLQPTIWIRGSRYQCWTGCEARSARFKLGNVIPANCFRRDPMIEYPNITARLQITPRWPPRRRTPMKYVSP